MSLFVGSHFRAKRIITTRSHALTNLQEGYNTDTKPPFNSHVQTSNVGWLGTCQHVFFLCLQKVKFTFFPHIPTNI
jgi:hypothetical protein